jgi:hypothetical protein
MNLLEENLHQPECTGVHALHTVSSGQHMPELIVLHVFTIPWVWNSRGVYHSIFDFSLV